jgi:hypothetical protein
LASDFFSQQTAWIPFPQHNQRLVSILLWIATPMSLLMYNCSEQKQQQFGSFFDGCCILILNEFNRGLWIGFQRRGQIAEDYQLKIIAVSIH